MISYKKIIISLIDDVSEFLSKSKKTREGVEADSICIIAEELLKLKNTSILPKSFNKSGLLKGNSNLIEKITSTLKSIDIDSIYWPEILIERDCDRVKSHGEIYTPEDIVNFMLDRTEFHIKFAEINICDLAAGNGAMLYGIAKRLDDKSHLTGIDILNFSIELAFVNICLSNNKLSKRIRVDTFDSILDRHKFKDNYDLVISNPPYIGQKNNKDLFEPLKYDPYWCDYYSSKSDYLYFFIIQAITLAKTGGIITLVTTQYWLTATKANKLRRFVAENVEILEIHDFGVNKIFPNATGQENIIVIMKKVEPKIESNLKINYYAYNSIKTKNNKAILHKDLNRKIEYCLEIKENHVMNDFTYTLVTLGRDEISGDPWYLNKSFEDNKADGIKSKLGDYFIVQPGIQTGADKVGNRNEFVKNNAKYLIDNQINIGDGIYVINSNELNELNLNIEEIDLIKPFLKVGQLSPGGIKSKSDFYLIQADDIEELDNYPNLSRHLGKFKPLLDCRYPTYSLVNNRKEGKWWKLVGARPSVPFDSEKIISPSRATNVFFLYSNRPIYSSMDVFYTYAKDGVELPLKFVSAYINSNYIRSYLERNCKKKGIKFELYKEPISTIPFPKIDRISDNIIYYISGVYSLEQKNGYEYNETSNTWIKRKGIYDFILELKSNHIDENENSLDEQDKAYLLECVCHLELPRENYLINQYALNFIMDAIISRIIFV